MDHIMRLKDVVIDYVSPAMKRRRLLDADHQYCSMVALGQAEMCTDNPMTLELAGERSLSSCPSSSRKRKRKEFEQDKIKIRGGISHNSSFYKSQDSSVKGSDTESLETEPREEERSVQESTEDEVSSTSFQQELEEESEIEDIDAREEEEAAAKVREYLERQAELELRKSDVARVKASGDWHPDEIYLFERLSLRSFEVILPRVWKIDFPTLPHAIFAEDEYESTLVNTNFTSSSHGVKALQSLFHLGVRVRDNLLTGAPTEKLILREVNNYIKWSEKDGGYAKMRYIPVLVTVAARPRQTVESLSASVDKQMKFLAEKHRQAYEISSEPQTFSRQPPLLYGIIVAQTIVILVTLDSAEPKAGLRHMQHFNFREKGTDAWIGLAIAIIIIVARNYIMSIKDELEVEFEPETDVDL